MSDDSKKKSPQEKKGAATEVDYKIIPSKKKEPGIGLEASEGSIKEEPKKS